MNRYPLPPDEPDKDYSLTVLVCTIAFVIAMATLVALVDVAFGQYYNLDDITKDPYQQQNEALHVPYDTAPLTVVPNILPLECDIERPTPMDTYLGSMNGFDGMEIFMFDTNGDGESDAQLRLHPDDPNRYPNHYAFDRDYKIYDGSVHEPPVENYTTPEIIYEDTLRDGTCKGIEVRWTPQIEAERQAEQEKMDNERMESDCIAGDCDTRQRGDL